MQQRKFLTTEMISERSAEFHNYKVAVAGAELNVVSDPRGLAGGSCGRVARLSGRRRSRLFGGRKVRMNSQFSCDLGVY